MDSSAGSRLWGVGPAFRLDRENPYLRLQNVTLFVRDQDRSLRFFVDLLGFSLVADSRVPEQSRWVAVAPPDGTAILALVTPKPDEEEYRHIGQARQIVLMTEDVGQRYLTLLDRLSQRQPTDPFVEAALGHKALAEGKNEEALAHLSHGLQLGEATVYEDMAKALSNLGRGEDALDYLKRGVDTYPFNAVLLKSLTLQYINLKRYAEARRAMERYVELLPEDSFMRKLLARVTN